MNDERRAEELYQRALDLPPAERSEFIRVECRGDPKLERRVRELLRLFEDAPPSFLKTPLGLSTINPDLSEVGPYRLEEVIGEGGMGVVHRARQTQPIQRTVALKIVKLGMDTREVIARFEAERQALAQLEHPNIARVYDAGVTPDGRPYFVMEYVDGPSITRHCDENRLTPRDRIDLLVQVCRGVQHAHQNGIIHRDLKPNNTLVATVDGRAIPKIIDFGVAKATQQKLTEATAFTQHGQLVGTPEYMSPEQASGRAVDTRSDVYSLGVMLYELLAGSLPLDAAELRRAGFEGMMNLIRDSDPPRPSTRVSSLGAAATEAATLRRTEPQSLARALRGELDWIAMRALEKNRERRYASAADLAADLQAHLRDEPVRARPQSTWYSLRKFSRRHRVAMGFAAVVAMALVAVASIMTFQAHRIARERDRSDHQAEVAQSVKDFLVDLFEESDPAESRGEERTARELLDDGAKRLKELDDSPVKAELLTTIGSVYQRLGLWKESAALHEEALHYWEESRGPGDVNTLLALNQLGHTRVGLGRLAAAESLYTRAIEGWARRGDDSDPHAFDPSTNLANVYRRRGNYDEAAELYDRLWKEREQLTGIDDPEVQRLKANRAKVYHLQHDQQRAEELYREVVRDLRRIVGEDHPQTVYTINALAMVLRAREAYAEAESLLVIALEAGRRVLGEENPGFWSIYQDLGIVYHSQKKFDRACEIFQETLEFRMTHDGPEHTNTLDALNNSAGCYSAQREYAKAQPLLEQVIELREKISGARHPATQRARFNLATVLISRGDHSEALNQLEVAVETGYDYPFLLRDDVQELFSPLHGDPRYEKLVETVRQRVEED